MSYFMSNVHLTLCVITLERRAQLHGRSTRNMRRQDDMLSITNEHLAGDNYTGRFNCLNRWCFAKFFFLEAELIDLNKISLFRLSLLDIKWHNIDFFLCKLNFWNIICCLRIFLTEWKSWLRDIIWRFFSLMTSWLKKKFNFALINK